MIRRLLFFLIVPFLITPVRSEVRHLIIVDISQTMATRKAATVNMVRDLVGSGFQGQIRTGDKFGIWVYNEHNYWKRFALQTWDPAKSKLIAEVAAQFLSGENFEKRNRFDLVAADIERLFSAHSDILLNIITDGENALSGIDYDIEINTQMSEYKRKLGQKRSPFMINLLALKGKIQTWRLYAGQGELELPRLPLLEDPALAKAAEQKKAEEAAKEKKAKEEKPPVVVELPPGAKVAAPKPLELPAPAPTTPPVVEVKTKPAPSTNESVSVASATPAPEPKVELTNNEPKDSKAPETNLVAAATKEEPPSKPDGKVEGSPASKVESSPVVLAARTESSATGPLFYCIAALGFLLPTAAVLVYLQRRSSNRGSIISQSMLRDLKSGML